MASRIVESRSNPAVQMLRDLHESGGRREHNAFLVEGVRLVAEAVAASWPLLRVLYDEDRAREESDLRSLVARVPGAQAASARAIKFASDTVTPQGIVAAAELPRFPVRLAPGEPLVLVIDGVADPGNAGTLLRSALGAGLSTVLASRGSTDLFSPKVVRSAMGAHFHLAIGGELTWSQVEGLLGEERMVVVADGKAPTLYHQFDWKRPAALVVGSEAHGPSPEARRRAGELVSIPLSGGVESLNAAVAASIILFEAKRQRDIGNGQ